MDRGLTAASKPTNAQPKRKRPSPQAASLPDDAAFLVKPPAKRRRRLRDPTAPASTGDARRPSMARPVRKQATDRRRRKGQTAAAALDHGAKHAPAAAAAVPSLRRDQHRRVQKDVIAVADGTAQQAAEAPPVAAVQHEAGEDRDKRLHALDASAALSVSRKRATAKREGATAAGPQPPSVANVPARPRRTSLTARTESAPQQAADQQQGEQAPGATAPRARASPVQKARCVGADQAADQQPRHHVAPPESAIRRRDRKRPTLSAQPAEEKPAEGEVDAAPVQAIKRRRKERDPAIEVIARGGQQSKAAATGPAKRQRHRAQQQPAMGRCDEEARQPTSTAPKTAQPAKRRDRQRERAVHPSQSRSKQVPAHAPMLAPPTEWRRRQAGSAACLSNDDSRPSSAAVVIPLQPRQPRRRQRQPATERPAGSGQQPAAADSRTAQPRVVQERQAPPAPVLECAQTSRVGAKATVAAHSPVSEPVPPPHHSPRRIRAAAPLAAAPPVEEREAQRVRRAVEPAASADRCNVRAPDQVTAMVRHALIIDTRGDIQPASVSEADAGPLSADECIPALPPAEQLYLGNGDRAEATVVVLPAPEGLALGQPAASCPGPVAEGAEQRPSTAGPQASATALPPTAGAAGPFAPSAVNDPLQAELLAALRVFEHSDAERRQFHECEPPPAAPLVPITCSPDLTQALPIKSLR